MFPAWLEAIVLGIVQGLTEFIPVSSSGHLVLVPYLLGWEPSSLAFDVMLHVGTLGAVLLYFRRELQAIASGVLGLDRSERGRLHRRLGILIVLANIPIGIVGLTLAPQVESVFARPAVVACLLLVTAALLVITERVRDRRVAAAAGHAGTDAATSEVSPTATMPATMAAGRNAGSETSAPTGANQASGAWQGDWRAADLDAGHPADDPVATPAGFPLGTDAVDPDGTDLAGISMRQALTVGLLQCFAVLPGISRSGTTIAAGVGAGLTREAATRFSFLLVIPALLGATVLSLPDLGDGGESAVEILLGTASAFIAGYLAIRYLVALVSRARLTVFAWYCVAAAVLSLIGYAMLGPISTV